MGLVMLCLLFSGIVWIFFGYYLNKVWKHRYGKQEKCCYCLDPKHCKNKILPEGVSSSGLEEVTGVGRRFWSIHFRKTSSLSTKKFESETD